MPAPVPPPAPMIAGTPKPSPAKRPGASRCYRPSRGQPNAAERGLWAGGHGVLVPYACPMGVRTDEGVLITGVYGAGKSTVAAEISYLLEQRRQPYALLDLDFLGWGVNTFDGRAAESPFLLRNLAAVISNYRAGGISVFVLAYFVSSHDELRGIREAVGVPLRVVRLSVPLPDIEQRLAADVTTERRASVTVRRPQRRECAGAWGQAGSRLTSPLGSVSARPDLAPPC